MRRLTLVFALLLAVCSASAGDSPTDASWLLKIVDDGAVAYQTGPRHAHKGNPRLYLIELRDIENVVELGEGHAPEFSPDSSKLAWVRDEQAVGRLRKGDDTVHLIADGIDPQAGVHWIDSDTVVVRFQKGGWHRVALTGQREPLPELEKIAYSGRETDVRLGEDGVWSFVAGQKWSTGDGKTGRIPGNCSSSLSPDGRSVGALKPGHKQAQYTSIRDGGAKGKLHWKHDKGFDNHRWSSNDPRFFVAEDEKFRQPVILMTGSPTRALRLAKAPAAREDVYGDITIGKTRDVKWPTAQIVAADPPPDEAEQDKQVTRIELVGKLREKAAVPDRNNYPEALVVYRYEVRKVTDGKLDDDPSQVFVAHWVIRDRKVIQPIAERKVGSTHTMTLEPLDAHPDASSQQVSLPDSDAVLIARIWLDVK
jgi:hypothetical protein